MMMMDPGEEAHEKSVVDRMYDQAIACLLKEMKGRAPAKPSELILLLQTRHNYQDANARKIVRIALERGEVWVTHLWNLASEDSCDEEDCSHP